MPPHSIFLIAAAAALAFTFTASASRPASAHEYIVNGSFDSGTDGWTLVSDGSTLDTTPDDVAPQEGDRRARITLGPSQSQFTLTQSLHNVPPGTYRVSTSVQARTSNAQVTVTLVLDGVADGTLVLTDLVHQWQVAESTIEIPHGVSLAAFRIRGQSLAGDQIYVDNVRFDGASPATMTPTYTSTVLPATNTPNPPTPTKTPKAATASPAATATSSPVRQDPPMAVGSLNNGGFEEVAEGLPIAWAKYGGSLSVATSPVRSGARSARLESTTDSTKWLYQPVVVTGGSSYAFAASAWHDDANAASVFLRVSWYATLDASGEAIGTADSLSRLDVPAPGWRPLTTGGVTAPLEAKTAKLRIMLQPRSGSRAAVLVDDASFVPADPASSAPPQAAAIDEDQAGSVAAREGRQSSDTPGGLSGGTMSLSSDLSTSIIINEVLYDSTVHGDSDGEWVELYNSGGEPVSLDGWVVADNHAADSLPASIIGSGDYLVIVASDSLYAEMIQSGVNVALVSGDIGNALGNSGDVLALIAPDGRFADAVSWGDNVAAFDPSIADVPAGHSVERLIPGGDTGAAKDFIDNEQPSPGHPYRRAASQQLPHTASGDSVEIVAGESGMSFGWLPWILAAGSSAALAVVASWRVVPLLTERLRHG